MRKESAQKVEGQFGRPKISEELKLAIRKELVLGTGKIRIGKALGVGTGTVCRVAEEGYE